ncbi:MAG TPA: glycosyltransferase family 4 protein [Solirubrobacteraceae bacterium]|nr:glycosyltransferase family 4 protein [Solirubrobacteraceae bacterium]
MSAEPLHIAWLGPVPGDGGGVAGVAGELLHGLAARGHRIDCFFATSGHKLPERLADQPRLTWVWGTSTWRWDRWYSRGRVAAFASGMLARAVASLRLRRELAARHTRDPYDAIYQFSHIETLAVPGRLARTVPLVLQPETHAAGELRALLAERELAARCQPRRTYLAAVAAMSLRALVQRLLIRRARLLVCISAAFREHLVRDYGFPAGATVVVPNPVRLERFAGVRRELDETPTVLVLGRIAARKGVEDVVALARLLHARGANVRFRIIGGPSLWSDYTKLLEELPAESAEYVGAIPAAQVAGELARSDMLLQASHYEPFALTVAEALACGVPVVATTEVGASEGVKESVAVVVTPGDVEALAEAVLATIARVRADPQAIAEQARAEAARLFAPERVCGETAHVLGQLASTPSGNHGPNVPSRWRGPIDAAELVRSERHRND